MRFSRPHRPIDALLFCALLYRASLFRAVCFGAFAFVSLSSRCVLLGQDQDAVLGQDVPGQDAVLGQTEPDRAETLDENRREAVAVSAERFQLYLNSDAGEPLERRTVFQWADPVLPEGKSLCLLYFSEGRPVASCKVYQTRRSIVHTFVSMTDQRLVARMKDDWVWTPPKSGLEFHQVADVIPADNPARRRIQMKAIARKFSAITGSAEATRQQAVPELRLLPTPLHRYPEDQSSDEGVFDGAVFAFVVGSGNPQVLLVLEAVREGEQTRWRYALSRRTLAKLEVSYQGQRVWEVPFFPQKRMTRVASFCKINMPLTTK